MTQALRAKLTRTRLWMRAIGDQTGVGRQMGLPDFARFVLTSGGDRRASHLHIASWAWRDDD